MPSAGPAPRATRWLRLLAVACGAGLSYPACSSTTPAAPVAAGPAALHATWGLDCDGLLAVSLVLSNWTLRPPFTCAGTPQCGSARVTVSFADGSPPLVATATTTAFVVDLGAYTEVTRQGLSVSLELIDDSGHPFAL